MKQAVNDTFSSQRLERLGARFQADIDAARLPGAVMQIVSRGETVFEAALGKQDPATGAPMRMDTIFRIYSMTKPIVSLGIMMLAEEGRLLISDPVEKHLPELKGLEVGVESTGADGRPVLTRVPAVRPPTVQDLLRHTAGLTYGIFGDSLVKAAYREAGVGSFRSSSDDFMRRLSGLPLAYQPGTIWEYSHATDVLGVLLERLSGQPLDVFLAERIFAPLGMRDTGFWVEEGNHGRIAEAFERDPVTGASVRLLNVREKPSFLSGGGGLVSTIGDYRRFAQMLLNGGELEGARLVSRKTLEHMASDHLAEMPLARSGQSFLPGPGYGFGLGFAVRTANGCGYTPGSVGEFLWSGLAGTYFWIDPREDMLAILMIQAPEQRDHYRQLFRTLVYAAIA